MPRLHLHAPVTKSYPLKMLGETDCLTAFLASVRDGIDSQGVYVFSRQTTSMLSFLVNLFMNL
jgi:hypothetical protein